jgi:protein-S-isoprenylcysteine O-methyltransferase Ste14
LKAERVAEDRMHTLRYAIALLVVVAFPPAFVFWLLVHPFARVWRRLGPTLALAILYALLLLAMLGVFLAREGLLAVEFGTRWPLVAVGAVCLVAAALVLRAVRRQLAVGVQMGIPELDPRGEQRLLTEGVYARVRHPRYLEMLLALLGFALVANYLAGYVVFALGVLAMHLVVLLEERELRERFGATWDAYAARVPRYLPRRRDVERSAHVP